MEATGLLFTSSKQCVKDHGQGTPEQVRHFPLEMLIAKPKGNGEAKHARDVGKEGEQPIFHDCSVSADSGTGIVFSTNRMERLTIRS